MTPRGRSTTIASIVLLLGAVIAALTWNLQAPDARSQARPSTAPAGEPATDSREDSVGPAGSDALGLDSSPVRPRAFVDDPYGSLLVHVLWADDKRPAAGIRCRVTPVSEPDADLKTRSFVTAPDGTFRLDPVRAGRVELRFDGGANAAAEVTAETENETTVVLESGCTVEGMVVDQAAKPVPGANLYVGFRQGWTYSSERFFQDPPVARSGDDGRFKFRLAREDEVGANWVGARSQGFAPSPTQRIVSSRGAVFRMQLALGGRGGSVVGRVIAPDGRGIAGATVMAARKTDGDFRILPDGTAVVEQNAFRTTTESDGRFSIDGLKPGPAKIEARAPGSALWSGSLEIVAGERATLEIRLGAGASVSGTVLDEDRKPVEGAEVRVTEPFSGLGLSRTRSLGDGAFRLEGLPAGPTRLTAFAEGRGSATIELVLLADAQARWDAVLSPGMSLIGRVIDSNDGPLSGWSLRAYSLAADDTPSYLRFKRAVSGDTGQFTFRHLANTSYQINVSPPGYSSMIPDASVHGIRPGDEEVVIRIRPEWIPSAFVTGVVTDGEDRPVGSAVVFLWLSKLGFQGDTALTEEGTGRFRIGPVAPMSYGVDIYAPHHAPLRIEPRPVERGATLDFGTLKLARPGFLKARLQRDDGGPLTGLELRVLGIRPYADFANLEGDLARATLGAGKYRLFVSSQEIAGSETPFEIRAGEETELDIILKAGVQRTVTFLVPAGGGRPRWLHTVLRDASDRVLRETDNLVFVEGRFWWYPSLVPGTYKVEARTDTGLAVAGSLTVRDLTPSQEPIEFQLK